MMYTVALSSLLLLIFYPYSPHQMAIATAHSAFTEINPVILDTLKRLLRLANLSRNPVLAQRLRLEQHRLHGVVLEVGRIAVVPQDPLHDHLDLRAG